MLLGDYMGVAHVPTLNQIQHFEFGDHYAVVSKMGKTVVIPTLDDILDIMVDEFEANGSLAVIGLSSPKIHFRRYLSTASQKPGTPMLVVEAVRHEVGAPIRVVAEQVRIAVIGYSLSGEWVTFAKDNL